MRKNKKDIKQQEQKTAELNQKLKEYQTRTGHGRPTTRREFLNSGLIGFAGTMMAPSFLEMFLRSTPAYAAECAATTAANQMVPFVTINLSGGWGAAANWIPRDIGGQLLPSYSQLGSGTVPTTVTAFSNNALFSANSNTAGFLAGVRSAATAATIQKSSFIGMPVSSGDDTSNDRFDVGGLLAAAGLAGQKLPGLGQQATVTGLRMQPALAKAPPSPLNVRSINDILNALGSAGSLAAGLNAAQQKNVLLSLVKTVKNLSDSQARELANVSGGSNAVDLVDCSTQKNVDNISQGTGAVDPRTNTALAVNATTATNGANGAPLWNFGNGDELARAAMTMNALNGLSGAIGMEMGGYDYHGNARTVTDGRDLTAGRLVGQVLESAAKLNKPVFIYLISDGAVVYQNSATAGTNATGDSGNRGVAFMIAFRPTTAPQAKSSQIGGFTTGQAANTNFISGWNADRAAAAAFVNWAQLNNNTALIQKVIPNHFSSAELNLVNMFG